MTEPPSGLAPDEPLVKARGLWPPANAPVGCMFMLALCTILVLAMGSLRLPWRLPESESRFVLWHWIWAGQPPPERVVTADLKIISVSLELDISTWLLRIFGSAVAATGVVIVAGSLIRDLRIAGGRCPQCGFDLRADSAGRCPECGILCHPRAPTWFFVGRPFERRSISDQK